LADGERVEADACCRTRRLGAKKRKRAHVKRINVYLDDSVFQMKDSAEITLQSLLKAPHHGNTQFRLFYGGDVQFATA